jgi:hypothetical protein
VGVAGVAGVADAAVVAAAVGAGAAAALRTPAELRGDCRFVNGECLVGGVESASVLVRAVIVIMLWTTAAESSFRKIDWMEGAEERW